ncbi:MAG: hypothetical protein HFH82_09270 [Lachnospiraceae bacterium]|nr:hypothetical protein [Lachnospiraceae bacterium]
MKIVTCKINEMVQTLRNDRIILFGVGEFYRNYVAVKFPVELIENVIYAVDNCEEYHEALLGQKKIPVYQPEILMEERDCTILLTSTMVMYDMYLQLESMKLPDDIKCGAIPFMFAESVGKTDDNLCSKILNKKKNLRINKTIHSFWFSGDKKPNVYQECINSWHKVCPDYDIKEWNLKNYDVHKNSFMEQAVEKKKWAFVSDYARLDVIYQYGGIYMDMDMELRKPLDILLGNKAFFSFDMLNDIDLAAFGAEPGLPLLKELMNLYENVEFTGDGRSMNYFCQPRYIRPVLEKTGVMLNGNMQYIDEMIFLPRNYLSPKDMVVYEMAVASNATIGVHHFNAGWKEGDYLSQRLLKNRKLEQVFGNEEAEF